MLWRCGLEAVNDFRTMTDKKTIAVYTKTSRVRGDAGLVRLLGEVDADFYDVGSEDDIREGTDFLMSVGGDGTFLSSARMACRRGIPVIGVNLGRMGFLSEYSPEQIAEAFRTGDYSIEEREMLAAKTDGMEECYALNEVSLTRIGSAMLGVDVCLNGVPLPTYWADGLLVATGSGSTAYSLSAGGPICSPDSKVLVITPVAPHNLNVRPLVVPSSSVLSLSVRSRDEEVMFTCDNEHRAVGRDVVLSVSLAQFSLKRLALSGTNFIGALRSKLFWGEDVRNAEP